MRAPPPPTHPPPTPLPATHGAAGGQQHVRDLPEGRRGVHAVLLEGPRRHELAAPEVRAARASDDARARRVGLCLCRRRCFRLLCCTRSAGRIGLGLGAHLCRLALAQLSRHGRQARVEGSEGLR